MIQKDPDSSMQQIAHTLNVSNFERQVVVFIPHSTRTGSANFPPRID